jgi:hypothetical protein
LKFWIFIKNRIESFHRLGVSDVDQHRNTDAQLDDAGAGVGDVNLIASMKAGFLEPATFQTEQRGPGSPGIASVGVEVFDGENTRRSFHRLPRWKRKSDECEEAREPVTVPIIDFPTPSTINLQPPSIA